MKRCVNADENSRSVQCPRRDRRRKSKKGPKKLPENRKVKKRSPENKKAQRSCQQKSSKSDNNRISSGQRKVAQRLPAPEVLCTQAFKNVAKKVALCLDVPTRWNSTYFMLDTTRHFELAFERYSFYDITFLDHLHTYLCEDETRAGILISVDRKSVR